MIPWQIFVIWYAVFFNENFNSNSYFCANSNNSKSIAWKSLNSENISSLFNTEENQTLIIISILKLHVI